MKRMFVAIDIDKEHKEAIKLLQKQLKQDAKKLKVKDCDVTWVNSKQIHLTLKFLGEVEEDRIDKICNAVENAAKANKGFEVVIGSAGYFGKNGATVVWVGINDSDGKILKLHDDIENELEIAGFEKEARDFHCHLTLARVKHPIAGIKIAKLLDSYKDYTLGKWKPDQVKIYESKLTPDGPIYTLVESYKLKD
jgi:RNA 2',3'-cyclic 3'-phosphodiesterase